MSAFTLHRVPRKQMLQISSKLTAEATPCVFWR